MQESLEGFEGLKYCTAGICNEVQTFRAISKMFTSRKALLPLCSGRSWTIFIEAWCQKSPTNALISMRPYHNGKRYVLVWMKILQQRAEAGQNPKLPSSFVQLYYNLLLQQMLCLMGEIGLDLSNTALEISYSACSGIFKENGSAIP